MSSAQVQSNRFNQIKFSETITALLRLNLDSYEIAFCGRGLWGSSGESASLVTMQQSIIMLKHYTAVMKELSTSHKSIKFETCILYELSRAESVQSGQ